MVSEQSQSQRITYLYKMFRISNFIETQSRMSCVVLEHRMGEEWGGVTATIFSRGNTIS